MPSLEQPDHPLEVTALGADRWAMWAGQREGSDVFFNPGSHWYVVAHADTPIPVVVALDDEGPYWAWVAADGDGAPDMISGHRGMYDMQFAYGPDPEEARGRGRTVRVNITAT